MKKITLEEWCQINSTDFNEAIDLFATGKMQNAYTDHNCNIHIYAQDTMIEEHIYDVIKTEKIKIAASILESLVDKNTSHNDIIVRLIDAMDLEEATITQ